jgi:hypothetical protein
MRTLGALLLLVGIVGFFYCSSHMSGLESIPEGTSLGRYLEYDAGKFELGRYASLVAALIGVILSMFPKGR